MDGWPDFQDWRCCHSFHCFSRHLLFEISVRMTRNMSCQDREDQRLDCCLWMNSGQTLMVDRAEWLNSLEQNNYIDFNILKNIQVDWIAACVKTWYCLKCLYHGWGFYIYLQYLEPCDKNCNISCHSNILSSWNFWLLKLTEVTWNQESVLQWIHAVINMLKIYHLIQNRIGTIWWK